ncbi:Na(+)-translocating NADH-quinone reductase subunit C [Parendozoicomonas haliclonae]|uniref:Na(+)-translocating NADH-quinone reductase subunit C n=1 Tax=Parendozoicomonas haliclonae TaxID=1960125 RepID=A0A1X7AKE5_9GAMM|nr:Na(+)-translocating NADH-quinone reductase subunit C [Parendozoicomonas haliclonae]SMA47829.1 Na(+)-translocating NADH-quinone reductase subunit C [Parendozoicomonas haliclonae]
MANDSIKKTLGVTIGLSLVCSVLVSAAAVFLKPTQVENQQLDLQKNILAISGLVKDPAALSKTEIQDKFKEITPKLVDIKTGKFVTDVNGMDAEAYVQQNAAKDPAQSRSLAGNDPAGIVRQANVAKIYEVVENGKLKTLILPVHGRGLWSTLYGYIALEQDMKTVSGFGFYQHGETPGLGGEVDNARWKASWVGKEITGKNGELAIKVIKGAVNPASPNAINEIDGLSGATLTVNGVNNLVQFWLGKEGFGPFLANLNKGEA